jgi:hypothetical protein
MGSRSTVRPGSAAKSPPQEGAGFVPSRGRGVPPHLIAADLPEMTVEQLDYVAVSLREILES